MSSFSPSGGHLELSFFLCLRVLLAMSVLDLFERLKQSGKYPKLSSLTLKEKQAEVLQSLLGHNDTLAVLPTGYGKSLIFALYPLLLDEVHIYPY